MGSVLNNVWVSRHCSWHQKKKQKNWLCFYFNVWQNKFKKQGNELIPTCPNEQGLMYQRLFEAAPLGQKLGMQRILTHFTGFPSFPLSHLVIERLIAFVDKFIAVGIATRSSFPNMRDARYQQATPRDLGLFKTQHCPCGNPLTGFQWRVKKKKKKKRSLMLIQRRITCEGCWVKS